MLHTDRWVALFCMENKLLKQSHCSSSSKSSFSKFVDLEDGEFTLLLKLFTKYGQL